MSCTCKKHDDYDLGTTVRIKGTLRAEGVPVDGDSVTLKVRRPDKTETTLAFTQDGPGNYYRDVVVDQPGQWHYQWYSASPGALEEGSFIVRRSAFG